MRRCARTSLSLPSSPRRRRASSVRPVTAVKTSSRLSAPWRSISSRGLALLDQAPGVDHAEPVAVALGLLHQVGGDEDRRAGLLAQRLQALPHEPPRGRVQADGGLVEEQHLRPVEQRGGDLQAPQHAARERARQAVEHRLEAHRLDDLRDPLAALAAGHPGDAAVEVEVLVGGQRAVDGDRLRDVADRGAHRRAARRGRRSRPRARGPRSAAAAWSARGSWSSCRRRWGRAGRTPRRARPRRRRRRPLRARRSGRRGRRPAAPAGRRSRAPSRRPERRLRAGRSPRAGRRARGSCGARACASRDSSSWSLASSAARWRTSSSWRSMCPPASTSSSRRRSGATSSRRSSARTSARASSAASSVLELLERQPEQLFQAHHLAQALDLGARRRARCAAGGAPGGASGSSPISS